MKIAKSTPPQQGRFVKNNGFTIIEVALVLAIAGLIFLVVFLALPALQNSQKDTAKRQDVGRVVAAVQSYMADNPGSNWAVSYPNDSTMANYYEKLSSGNSTTSALIKVIYPTANQIVIDYGTRCRPSSEYVTKGVINGTGGDTDTQSGQAVDNSADVAVYTKLSSGNYYCQDL